MPDDTLTPVGTPAGQPDLTITYPGGATLEQAASVKHYLMKAPLSGDELLHYKFTRRKTEQVDFAADESGMTAKKPTAFWLGSFAKGKTPSCPA